MPNGPLRQTDRPKGWQPADEQRFRQWYAEVAKQFDYAPDPDDPLHHYNYRHAFKAGAWPDAEGHWPSTFKDATHPNRFVGGEDTTVEDGVPNETLAQKVRAKSPGTYDDLSDDELEAAVRAKYPGIYDDLTEKPATAGPQKPSKTPSLGSLALRASALPITWPAEATKALAAQGWLDEAGAIGGGMVGSLLGPAAGLIGAGLGGGGGGALQRFLAGQPNTQQAIERDIGLGGLGQAAGGALSAGAGVAARGLGRLALNPSKAVLKEFPDVVQTMLAQGTNVTPAGEAAAMAARRASGQATRDIVQGSTARVPIGRVTQGVNRLQGKFARTRPEANVDIADAGEYIRNVEQSHPGTLSLDDLLMLKQGADDAAVLAHKAAGVGNLAAGVKGEANKALADEARSIIGFHAPAARAQNRTTQSLIGLEKALDDATHRPGMGRYLLSALAAAGGGTMGVGPALTAGGVTALAGSPRVLGRAALTAHGLAEHPQIPITAMQAILSLLDQPEPE